MNRTGSIGLLSLALLAASCSEQSAPDVEGPAAAALHVFEAAGSDEPVEAELLALFEPPASEAGRVELLELLDALAELPAAVVEEVQQTDPGEAFVDLAVELAGGGSAAFTVRLRADEAKGWLVTWVQGPGLEWPRRRPRGDGLSTSSGP